LFTQNPQVKEKQKVYKNYTSAYIMPKHLSLPDESSSPYDENNRCVFLKGKRYTHIPFLFYILVYPKHLLKSMQMGRAESMSGGTTTIMPANDTTCVD